MPSPTIVRYSVNINAPVMTVWEALTNVEKMMEWVSDSDIHIISEGRVGGSIYIDVASHGMTYRNKGTILEMDPGKIFSYNYWTPISRMPDVPENYSVIEFILRFENEQTVLTVTQSNLVAETAFEHSDFYWKIALDVLKKLAEKEYSMDKSG